MNVSDRNGLRQGNLEEMLVPAELVLLQLKHSGHLEAVLTDIVERRSLLDEPGLRLTPLTLRDGNFHPTRGRTDRGIAGKRQFLGQGQLVQQFQRGPVQRLVDQQFQRRLVAFVLQYFN